MSASRSSSVGTTSTVRSSAGTPFFNDSAGSGCGWRWRVTTRLTSATPKSDAGSSARKAASASAQPVAPWPNSSSAMVVATSTVMTRIAPT